MAELSSSPEWLNTAQTLVAALKEANALKNRSAVNSPDYVAAKADIARLLSAVQELASQGAKQVDESIAHDGVMSALKAQTATAKKATNAIKSATDKVAALGSAVDTLTKLVAQFSAVLVL